MNFQELRKKHPRFVFDKYSYRISGNNLEVFFNFKIEPGIRFRPKIIIRNIDGKKLNELENLIFHLGLMEIPTYWKATCSPKIIIKAGFLKKKQINWWKNLIIKGMGQFFYENKIDWRTKNFLKIECQSNNKYKAFSGKLKNRYLVPFSGGRDSIVTIELLKKKVKTALFLVNHNEQIKQAAEV